MTRQAEATADIAKTLELDRPSVRRHRLRVGILAATAVLVVAAGIAIGRSRSRGNAVQYQTEEAVRGDLTVIVTATGTLQPTNEVEVGSELSGTIQTVEADYNDRVTVGQVLARLDTSKIGAQATQSKAALEAAEAKVLQARATLKETQTKLDQLRKVWDLSGHKVPAQTELDAAEATFQRAKADEASALASVSQARATLEAIQTDLHKAVITSPIDGVVLSREVEPGQTVAASFTAPVMFTLAEDLASMELHVNVDEADIGKVVEGQDAEFTVSAYPNRRFQARITQARFGSSTTSGVVTYEAVLKVNNADLALRPGMTATADIMVQKVEAAVLIPNAALRFSPPVKAAKKETSGGLVSSIMPGPPRGGNGAAEKAPASKEQRVWTLLEGKLTAISVVTGSTDGTRTEVVSGGVQPGMALVTDTVTAEK
jgi:HlyD family secretion protein